MVIPAVTGLLVAHKMRTAFVVAIVSALLSTFIGFAWAINSDLPTSPPTIGVATIIMAVIWISRRFVKEA
jgi:ABC-type Mn2+/Zn2+ transport system permease subunit